jgi:GNAT superfamily N-acetyltransferase
VGELRWREWGRAPEPDRLEWRVEVTAREAGRTALPVTWVALDAAGQAVGAVGLGEFDIAERRDRSPWLLGMIVAPPLRGRGVGGRLLRALEAWARERGDATLWVATGGPAVAFYRKCGWQAVETFTRPPDEEVVILKKTV